MWLESWRLAMADIRRRSPGSSLGCPQLAERRARRSGAPAAREDWANQMLTWPRWKQIRVVTLGVAFAGLNAPGSARLCPTRGGSGSRLCCLDSRVMGAGCRYRGEPGASTGKKRHLLVAPPLRPPRVRSSSDRLAGGVGRGNAARAERRPARTPAYPPMSRRPDHRGVVEARRDSSR